MSALGTERTAVQNPLVRYAQEAGWIYLPREEALRLRRGEGGPVLYDVLIEQLQRLNPNIVARWRDEQAGDFETLVKTFVAPRRVLRELVEREAAQQPYLLPIGEPAEQIAAFEEHPHWRSSDDHEPGLRLGLYKALLQQAGVKTGLVSDLAERVMAMPRRAAG